MTREGESFLARPAPWGVILAEGDGTRLQPLTRRIAGEERPKQFCSIFGPETLLEQTRRRASLAVSPHRALTVVTRSYGIARTGEDQPPPGQRAPRRPGGQVRARQCRPAGPMGRDPGAGGNLPRDGGTAIAS